MSQIGTFTKTKDGYTGQLRTLTLEAAVTILPVETPGVENAPDFRIFTTQNVEIGAAWRRTGEAAGEYLSLSLDDPSFAHPIRANLFQSGAEAATWKLLWSRPSRRDEHA